MAKDTPAPVEAARKTQVTDYVVLHDQGETDAPSWREVGTVKGANATQAISKAAGDEPDGTYVAVPARSWRPVKPTVKVERRVAWS